MSDLTPPQEKTYLLLLEQKDQEIKKLKALCMEEIDRNTERGRAKEVREIAMLNQNLHTQLSRVGEEAASMKELIQEFYDIAEAGEITTSKTFELYKRVKQFLNPKP